jgi:hypothetical protein
MGFWSGYGRYVRLGRTYRVWVRRAKCRWCRATHALLPSFALLRRLDAAEVIGSALERAVAGVGLRPVAMGLAVPHATARDWRRRFRARAPTLTAGLGALAVELGVPAAALPASGEVAALAALWVVWAWVRQRRGDLAPTRWRLAATVSGGGWLHTTRSPPWAGLGRRGWMPPVP